MSRQELGRSTRYVPSTRVHNAPGGNQSFNMFAAPASVLSPKNMNETVKPSTDTSYLKPKTTTKVHAAPGGRSSVATLLAENDENLVAKSSTRVHAAPGGADSVSNFLSHSEEAQPVQRSSTRLHAAPGGKDSMSSLLAASNEDVAVRSTTRLHAAPGGRDEIGNIFSDAAEPGRPRSSSRVLAPPGGSSESKISALLSHQLSAEPVKTFMTSKTNQSHDVILPNGNSHSLPPSPTKDFKLRSYKTNESHALFGDSQSNSLPASPNKDFRLRSYKTNESHAIFGQATSNSLPASPTKDFRRSKTNDSQNVTNLTPKAAASRSSRTYRTNTCSTENNMAQPDFETQVSKHSVHNQQMAGSNIFADQDPYARKGRTTVRLHHAPGGSSNISWK